MHIQNAYYAMANSRIIAASFKGKKAVIAELEKLHNLIASAGVLYLVKQEEGP